MNTAPALPSIEIPWDSTAPSHSATANQKTNPWVAFDMQTQGHDDVPDPWTNSVPHAMHENTTPDTWDVSHQESNMPVDYGGNSQGGCFVPEEHTTPPKVYEGRKEHGVASAVMSEWDNILVSQSQKLQEAINKEGFNHQHSSSSWGMTSLPIEGLSSTSNVDKINKFTTKSQKVTSPDEILGHVHVSNITGHTDSIFPDDISTPASRSKGREESRRLISGPDSEGTSVQQSAINSRDSNRTLLPYFTQNSEGTFSSDQKQRATMKRKLDSKGSFYAPPSKTSILASDSRMSIERLRRLSEWEEKEEEAASVDESAERKADVGGGVGTMTAGVNVLPLPFNRLARKN
jgi:hypothetical protein